MITGGYNIIDFGGAEFTGNQNITVDSSIVDKLKDITKPCFVGNFKITLKSFNSFVAPTYTAHYIVEGAHAHIVGDIILSVTGDTTIMFAE